VGQTQFNRFTAGVGSSKDIAHVGFKGRSSEMKDRVSLRFKWNGWFGWPILTETKTRCG
jgi:hypothetical protein